MKSSTVLRPLLTFFCTWLAFITSGQAAPMEIERQTLSEEQLDQFLADKKHVDFKVTLDGSLIDSSGKTIRITELKKTLKKGKYDRQAFYVLWKESTAVSAKQIDPIIPILINYGVDKIVFRIVHDPNVPKPGTKETEQEDRKQKMLVLKGANNPKSHTASDPIPAMSGRPPELRPGKLPRRVRYQFKDDAIVAAAAELAHRQLLSENPATPSLFSDLVLINPGAWPHFRNNPSLGKKECTRTTNTADINGKQTVREGMLLRDKAEIQALESALRDLIKRRGGGTLRALTTAEMDHWWTFITLDIEEPVFVLETKDRAFSFVLAFSDKGLFILDELVGLKP